MRARVYTNFSLLSLIHTLPILPLPFSFPLQTASPLSPAVPTRYVLEPTQVASAVHQLPGTSVADLREGRKHLFGGRLGGAAAGVARRGLTPPRRGGRISAARREFWRFRYPSQKGARGRFMSLTPCSTHLRPLFSPRSLYARDRDVPSFLRCGSREGWACDPVPERADWARRPVGAEMGTLLASPSRKSLPRARWSRFSKDQKGRQDLLQLQKYFKVVYFWFTK